MRIKHYPLNHFNERPDNVEIDTVVIHSMYAKDQSRPTAALKCFLVLDENKVSSHYSIDRKGCIWQHVEDLKRAWHAGESKLPCPPSVRENVNDFSIGIEMIGVWGKPFKARQYRSLNKLLQVLRLRFPIKHIVSHQIIAPERKNDPGPSFRWDKVKRSLKKERHTLRILS